MATPKGACDDERHSVEGEYGAGVTTPSTLKPISDWEFEQYVQAEVDGEATPEQLAVLEADRMSWRTALLNLRRDAEEHLASARNLRGDERAQVIADLESEQHRLAAAWARHNNLPIPPKGGTREPAPRERQRARRTRRTRNRCPNAPATVQLQASWVPGRVVAWAAGGGERNVDTERLTEMLACGERAERRLDEARTGFGARRRARRRARQFPSAKCLGWLVAAGADQVGDDIGPSVRWLGRVAIWAVELTAHGSMVPLLAAAQAR